MNLLFICPKLLEMLDVFESIKPLFDEMLDVVVSIKPLLDEMLVLYLFLLNLY